MKKRHFALALAFVFALGLAGCSANREENSDPVVVDNSAGVGSGSQNSDGIGGSVQNSAGIGGSADGNDAMQGGGAGGTNDLDNDGLPDGADSQDRDHTDNGGSVVDDIGDAVGDAARGAGDVVRDAGDAIGRAANDVGNAMR